jgi:hypothetical protein
MGRTNDWSSQKDIGSDLSPRLSQLPHPHIAIPPHFPYTPVIPTNFQTVHCQKLGAPGKVLKEKTHVTYSIDAQGHCGLAG